MNKRGTEKFRGSENTMHDTILVNILVSLCTVQTHRTYSTKSEPYCNLWPLMVMMCVNVGS